MFTGFALLGRFRDIESKVRLLCLQSCKHFYREPELLPDLILQWNDRHCDSEEAIRREVIKLVSMVLDCPDRHALLSEEVLVSLCTILKDRMLDKKWQVRKTAMTSASLTHLKIWSSGDSLDKIKSSASCVDWVLEKLLHQYYQPFNHDKCYVTYLIIRQLFPTDPLPNRYAAIVTAFKTCNENAALALNDILRKKVDTESNFRTAVDPKSSHDDKTNSIKLLRRYLPEPEYLSQFLEMVEKDRKISKSMREMLKQNVGVEASLRARDQILTALGAEHKCYTVARSVLDMSVSLLMDKEGVGELLKQAWSDLANNDSEGAECILKLVTLFVQNNASLLASQETLEQLLQLSHTDEQSLSLSAVEILSLNAGALRSCSYPVLTKIQTSMVSLTAQGTPKFAKFAVKYLSITCKDSHSVLHRALMKLKDNHMDFEDDNIETVITTFGCIGLFEPQVYTNKLAKEVINQFIIKQIISKDRDSPAKGRRGRAWEEESKVSREVRIKLSALKAVMRWLLGHEDKEESKIQPIVRLLCSVIENEGDLTNQGCLLPAEKAHMRLKAATCLLKLGICSS